MRYQDPALPIPERVADLLARMTREEKIAQLNQTYAISENRERVKEQIRRHGLGSRILTGSSLAGNLTERMLAVEDLNELQRVAVAESRLGIPLLHGRDVIHGHRTVFPIPLALAATFDPELVEAVCAAAAREARRSGVHWSFAPMIDIARDPRWGRIVEGNGEDPYLGAAMAAAGVRGFQGQDARTLQPYAPDRLLACAKHYVGYGAAEGGRDYNTAEISDNTLRNIYLPPFQAAIEAGVGSVMAAFQDLNGEPVSGSRYLLTDVLRGELGFEGIVVSDWTSVSELVNHRVAADRRAAARLAFDAGVDMDMCSESYVEHLGGLIDAGLITPERLDEACRRVLTAKFQLGLFERPYTDPARAAEAQSPPEHRALARRAAARGLVLLQNNGLLPLARGVRRLAVIGPLADQRRALLGCWVSDGLEAETPTLVEALRAAVAPNSELLACGGPLTDQMLMTAEGADVVVLAVGESDARTGENNHVASLDLPVGQDALIEAVRALGKPVALVVFAGRPVTLTRALRHADAVLYAWHPGSLGAAAVADALFGAVEPGGRLPVSLARGASQLPVHYNRKSTGRPWTPYRDQPDTPLFPFGFGLGYTSFDYTAIAVERAVIGAGEAVTVSALVTNTGARAGEAVVQCYLQDCVASTTRPVRELKGFARVALAPGEARRVAFTLGPEALSFYGRSGRRVEPGAFKVWIGADSTAQLETGFSVA